MEEGREVFLPSEVTVGNQRSQIQSLKSNVRNFGVRKLDVDLRDFMTVQLLQVRLTNFIYECKSDFNFRPLFTLVY